MSMSKTAALAASRKAHSDVMRFGYGYCFYAPYYDNKPNGPTTQCDGPTYWATRQRRTRRVVGCALRLMGYSDEDYGYLVEYGIDPSSADVMLDQAIRKLGKPS